jgi:hypothetical protein
LYALHVLGLVLALRRGLAICVMKRFFGIPVATGAKEMVPRDQSISREILVSIRSSDLLDPIPSRLACDRSEPTPTLIAGLGRRQGHLAPFQWVHRPLLGRRLLARGS